ncbi:MAG: TetR/AcrR family transcriptional regulator [Acidimicrobiales bacterium]
MNRPVSPATARRRGIPRERLLAVAAELFATRGYRATSLEDVGAALQVKKTAVYHYVDSKEQLLVDIFEALLEEMQVAAKAAASPELAPDERLRRLVHTHVRTAAARHHMLAVIFREEAELPKERRAWQRRRKRAYEKLFEDALSEGQAAGLLRPLNQRLVLSALFGMCNWLYQWYRPGEWDPDEIAAEFMLLLERGWLAGDDRRRGAWPRPTSVDEALEAPRIALTDARQSIDRLARELDRAAQRMYDGTVDPGSPS